MDSLTRFGIGFGLGILLSGCALVLLGIGHGTAAPLVGNVSLLIFLPVAGFVLAILGTPFLWGFYWAAIPKVRSGRRRLTLAGLVAVFHLGPVIASAFLDEEFAQAAKVRPFALSLYGAALLAAVGGVAYLSWWSPEYRAGETDGTP